ncbi:MAG: aminoglycoside phosphotransferase family protein [Armatimonadetes bacterium]|nr:aminoglycoside phosphotransferase family protein [Armatimonadota bacterium]
MNPPEPSPGRVEQVARLTRKRPLRWTPARGGYTQAERWIVGFDDGTSVFVKAANDQNTAKWLRQEYQIYSAVSRAFMPKLMGWEDGDRPLLLLEDLSRAHWPPPWNRSQVNAVLHMLEQLHATPPPSGVPRLTDVWPNPSYWPRIAEDPTPFLGLGLCSPVWLEKALPALIEAEGSAQLDGEELTHLDVRGDNLCIHRERAILVDWNWACIGNGTIDIVGWLPSLALEGGPKPEEVLSGERELAALLAGYWGHQSTLPPPHPDSDLRTFQRAQLGIMLPWAARELGLPEPVLADPPPHTGASY